MKTKTKRKPGRPAGTKKHDFSKMRSGKWYAHPEPDKLSGLRRTFQRYAKENGRTYFTKVAYDKLWLCIL